MNRPARAVIVVAAFLLVALPKAAAALQNGGDRLDPVAKRADIYCTGFIAEIPPRADLQVIGGERENLQNSFAQGNIVYLSKGREGGVHPGAVYYILRPLGEMKHPFDKKKRLGHFVRELGMLRVIQAYDKTASAEILVSCDVVELGDILKPYEEMQAPSPRDGQPLPLHGEGTGGAKGQIIYSRGSLEYLSANQVVFIDLGSRQGVQPGDYFTIFRSINRREGVASVPDDDIVQERSSGYGSERFKGGDYSMSSARVPRKEVLRTRPALPRKVLGELIVLKVEKSSAVALITRTAAEVNIGDFIERSN